MRNLNLTATLAWLAMLALSVAACGGGGGGGGGGGSGDSRPATFAGGSPVSRQAKKSDIASSELATAMSNGGTHNVRLPALGNTTVVSLNSDDELLIYDGTYTTFIPISYFDIHKNGTLTVVGKIKKTSATVHAGYDFVAVLGGKHKGIQGGLEYSNFGYWLVANKIEAAGGNRLKVGRTNQEYGVYAFGIESKKTGVASSGGTFNGTALAAAYSKGEIGLGIYDDTMVPLVGTAKLVMDSGGTTGKLTLDFKASNFFALSGPVNINSSGTLTGSFDTITGKDSTGIGVSSNINDYVSCGGSGVVCNNDIQGAAFGPAGNASEAVGSFILEKRPGFLSPQKGVAGSFGVKK